LQYYEDLFERIKMSDSKDKNNKESSEDFADDLDAILNDAESSLDEQKEQNDLIDDEDVIDQLLVDDELSSDELGDSVSAEKEIEYDEFADEDEFNVDDLLDSVDAEVKDEFSEAELTDSIIEDAVSESIQPEVSSEESADELDIDDLVDSQSSDEQKNSAIKDDLMADFDISADDDELLEMDEVEDDPLELVDSSGSQSVEQDNAIGNVESAEFRNELDAQSAIVAQTTQDVSQVNATINEMNAQVSQLWADNEGLKEQLATLTSTIAGLNLTTEEKDSSVAEEINALQKEQRKLRGALKESGSKVPVITYVTLAVAILALLVGGILGAIGYGAKTDAESLTEQIAMLEEEIEIISAKDTGASVREANFKINALQTKDEGFNEQLAGLNKRVQQPDALKVVVDDLVAQNDHAQKAIEGLLASVETLELQKSAISKKRVKKAKKAIANVEWAVNLVSFKQEWYAKRKAEEFKKKGIPAKVEEVKIKGKKWFRLRVKGFKSKYEAAAYAVKVKKTLNLSSVWVTKA